MPKKTAIQSKSAEIYQLKIILKDSRPPIWRRILLPADYTFRQLHQAIQCVFGWQDCHLHEFRTIVQGSGNHVRIGMTDVPDFENWDNEEILAETVEKIGDWLSAVSPAINYDYDFGDYWQHRIELEKILPREADKEYPICLSGKRACPPEDIGGVPGYEDFIQIMKDSKHPEYKELSEWIGEKTWDSECFNPEEVEFEEWKYEK